MRTKTTSPFTSRNTAALTLFLAIITLAGCMHRADSYTLEQVPWPQPAFEQGAKPQTAPGLSVVYFERKVRHINEMPDVDWMKENGSRGEPIPMIDHQFGRGEVFGSGMKQGVCVQMQGYLNFEDVGTYLIKANSNDGIRVFLDNKVIFEDPEWHGDRFTPHATISINKPGLYSFLLRYFQRKGTATLEMYWERPGSGSFEIIPAGAYSHDISAAD